MNKDFLRLFLLSLIVSVLTLSQAFGFSVFGIKPNLALVVFIASLFFIKEPIEGVFLLILSCFFIKFSAGFSMEILVFFVIGATIIALRNYLPWYGFLNNLFFNFSGTFAFYLFLDKNLIWSKIFFIELVLNLLFGSLFFALLYALWQNKMINK